MDGLLRGEYFLRQAHSVQRYDHYSMCHRPSEYVRNPLILNYIFMFS